MDCASKLCGASTYMRNDVGIAAADTQVALVVSQVVSDLIFVTAGAAVEYFNNPNSFGYTEFFQMSRHTDPLSPGMARYRHRIVLFTRLKNLR